MSSNNAIKANAVKRSRINPATSAGNHIRRIISLRRGKGTISVDEWR